MSDASAERITGVHGGDTAASASVWSATAAACEAWADTPYAARFDATVYSWREGCRKPDRRRYAAVAAQLGVPAIRCCYVGDGGGREHQGALAAGMRPVHVTNARCPGAAGHRAHPDPVVPKAVIEELDELPALLGWPGKAAHHPKSGACTKPSGHLYADRGSASIAFRQ